jgi:ADP-ribose pyrophosphatase
METNVDVRQMEQVLSPWVTLVTRRVQFAGESPAQEFHSFKLADYAAILAVTTAGKIPLVRQYRPALQRWSLELPSGLLEPAEEPARAAERELWEETGLRAGARVTPLGSLAPDSGRLENRLWGFFADGAAAQPSADWRPEPELENLRVSRQELKQMILDGRFAHALHVAVIGLALARGCFSFDAQTNQTLTS